MVSSFVDTLGLCNSNSTIQRRVQNQQGLLHFLYDFSGGSADVIQKLFFYGESTPRQANFGLALLVYFIDIAGKLLRDMLRISG